MTQSATPRSSVTLKQYLLEHSTPSELCDIINATAEACIDISLILRDANLTDLQGEVGGKNIQGEDQKKLDDLANIKFVEMMKLLPSVAAIASEEEPDISINPDAQADAGYLMAFDPLDGSSNLESNVSVGSIFSILPRPTGDVSADSFYQPGSAQVAAGYAMYGPATMLYLSVGQGTVIFTLDTNIDNPTFILSHPDISIPYAAEYAINHSNRRFWQPPIQAYIADCEAGETGPLARNYNMRWVASMVAEAARIFSRGGVFLYPRDNKDPSKAGRIRLLYEASPVAFLVEQANGSCTDGSERMLDVVPTSLHQRIGVVFGSAEEVETIRQYHQK